MAGDSPVIVACQGRTGGTALADVLARMAGGLLLLEPLHPHLGKVIREDPATTHRKLRHRIRPHPFRHYRYFPAGELLRLRGVDRLRYLADRAPARPVIKVCRAWGQLAELRQAVPSAKMVHLWRRFRDQDRSLRRAGIPHGYFGEPGRNAPDAWKRCKAEGGSVADVSLPYDALLRDPEGTLGILEATLQLQPGSGQGWAHLVVR